MDSKHFLSRYIVYLTFLLAAAALLVTASPAAAGRRSAMTFAYITNWSDGSVSVIDISDARRYEPFVQTTISLWPSGGDHPFGIAVPLIQDRDAYYEPHRAYTANNKRDATMSVIESTPGPDPRYDPWSHRLVTTVPVPGCTYPRGIAAHPDGTRVFLACGDGNVVVVSTTNFSVLADVDLGTGPGSFLYGIHVTPGGKKVYVTDQVANKLIVMNANNYNIKKRMTLPGPQPEGVHVDRYGRTVWIAYAGAGAGDIGVSVHDTEDESVLCKVRFEDDAYPASVYSPHPYRGYVTLYTADELAEIRCSRSGSSRILRRTPVGDAPQGLTADRRRNVYVADNGSSTVTTVFRRRSEPPLALGVGRAPTAFGEFIATKGCGSRCRK